MPPLAVTAPTVPEPKQLPLAGLLPVAPGGVGSGVMVIIRLSVTAPQGPAGSSLLRYSFTLPAIVSAEDGVYTAVNDVASSKVPLPLLVQLVVVVLPPLLPVRLAVCPAQMVWLLPASIVAAWSIVTITESIAAAQPPAAAIVFFTV